MAAGGEDTVRSLREGPGVGKAAMRDTDLFQQALGREQPWRVVDSQFEAKQQRLDLYLDFPADSTLTCPECGMLGCKVHDTEDKSWRHLDFFQHEARPARAYAARSLCAVWRAAGAGVSWARPGSGFALLFEAQ